VLLVRHGRAGDRTAWVGDDRERPLDAKGWRQAGELVGRLERFPIDAIYASPYLRCVQTVLPIAAARGLEPQLCDELGEELQLSAGAALVRDLAGRPVLVCGHGGLELALAEPRPFRKGAVLVVDAEGRVTAEA